MKKRAPRAQAEKAKSVGLYRYKGATYPDYLRRGNGMRFILPVAQQFCVGRGVDVGGGEWPFPGAEVVDKKTIKWTPTFLPSGLDYIFSSHCLEHLADPVAALAHWKTRLNPKGLVFLYLPHPDMRYWNPANCRKHVQLFHPADIVRTLQDLGYHEVLHSERDLAWSFAVVAYNAPPIVMIEEPKK